MAHVVFVSIPVQGHVVPTLGIVQELVARGHRVTFPTTAEFAGMVTGAGAEELLYQSTWASPASLPNPVDSDRAAEMRLLLAIESIAVADALRRAAIGSGADIVVYDTATACSARVLARSWERPSVQMFTGVASNERFSLAKAWPERFPAADADPAHPTMADVRVSLDDFWARYPLRGTNAEELLADSEDLSLVFQPRAFHIAEETFDHRYVFVGPCPATRAWEGHWTPPGDGRPILLISLGTLYNDQPAFFRECERAFSGSEWHVVTAIGHLVDPSDLGPVPANCERHRRVPQLDVLRHASAFVSHGGMGSTMEALFFGTPLVVVPQTPEQDAVARRVAELGLGRRLPSGEVSAERLREAVAHVAYDETTMGRVDEMRRLIAAAGGARAAVAAILSCL